MSEGDLHNGELHGGESVIPTKVSEQAIATLREQKMNGCGHRARLAPRVPLRAPVGPPWLLPVLIAIAVISFWLAVIWAAARLSSVPADPAGAKVSQLQGLGGRALSLSSPEVSDWYHACDADGGLLRVEIGLLGPAPAKDWEATCEDARTVAGVAGNFGAVIAPPEPAGFQ